MTKYTQIWLYTLSQVTITYIWVIVPYTVAENPTIYHTNKQRLNIYKYGLHKYNYKYTLTQVRTCACYKISIYINNYFTGKTISS